MKRVLLCAALLAWSGIASAVVYKWVDAQGKVQYGDRPPDGVHAEVVELLGNHALRDTQPQSSSPSIAADGDSKATRPATGRSGKNYEATDKPDEATKKAVADDVAQSKEKQCSDAQERYRKLIEGRRLYKEGADGERQYLSSDEIDSERVNAKRDVDATCNGSN